ncbi:MAG: T9SS type A sorting domain-containing protein, partial [Ignavibacteria bacterium]|nr:T9SS type A sorting domain-containing protein [Ignavibacteria bacterium]
YMGSSYDCGSYYMVFSPNPATSETTLELVAEGEKTVDDNTQWELEVYDQQQSLKEKKTKIKGKQTKLNTASWKDGVYIVRVKIGDEMISEKLVVKH